MKSVARIYQLRRLGKGMPINSADIGFGYVKELNLRLFVIKALISDRLSVRGNLEVSQLLP